MILKKKNTILRISRNKIYQMENPETMSLLCISTWKLIFTLSHHTTEDLRIILHYILMQVLGSKFHHIPVLNKPKCLSICDKLSKLNGTKSVGMCHLSCGEIPGKEYLTGDITFNECCLWLVNTKF